MKVKTTIKRLNQNIKLPNQTAERSDHLTLNKLNNVEAELVQASD